MVRAKKKITCLFFIEGVEWRVTEFRVITLTNHDTRRGSHEPIRTRLSQARETPVNKSKFVVVVILIG